MVVYYGSESCQNAGDLHSILCLNTSCVDADRGLKLLLLSLKPGCIWRCNNRPIHRPGTCFVWHIQSTLHNADGVVLHILALSLFFLLVTLWAAAQRDHRLCAAAQTKPSCNMFSDRQMKSYPANPSSVSWQLTDDPFTVQTISLTYERVMGHSLGWDVKLWAACTEHKTCYFCHVPRPAGTQAEGGGTIASCA